MKSNLYITNLVGIFYNFIYFILISSPVPDDSTQIDCFITRISHPKHLSAFFIKTFFTFPHLITESFIEVLFFSITYFYYIILVVTIILSVGFGMALHNLLYS